VLFVEEAPGRFVRRDVTLGEEREGFVQIVSGLSADERVAVSGTFLIKSKVVETGIPE
jgi:multidrug efflux pump subunit AcrA (membrane-fusion protein)